MRRNCAARPIECIKLVLHLPDIAREACTLLIGTIAKESSAAREAALLGRAERSSLKAA